MKITKHNLEHFIDEVVYNYAEEVLTIYTKINGYLIPMSIIHTNKELPDYITPSITMLDSLGFSRDVIYEGVLKCKLLHGYS